MLEALCAYERIQAKGWSIFGKTKPPQRGLFQGGGVSGEAGKSIISFRASFSPRHRIFFFRKKKLKMNKMERKLLDEKIYDYSFAL